MKKITILGAGESGVGAALLAKAKGYDVFVSDNGSIGEDYKKQLDKGSISYEENTHTESKVLETEEIVKSPGIPEEANIVIQAKEKGIAIISEIEFASRYTEAKIIGVTGSNGKTTTTLLIHHLLKGAGYKVSVAGNIGDSFAKQVIEDKFDYYVLELSSFQLDGVSKFRADVAVLLNITPDHLDRYDNDFQKYTDAKMKILQNVKKSGYFVFFSDDEVIKNEITKQSLVPFPLAVSITENMLNGAHLKNDNLQFSVNNHFSTMLHLDNVTLPLHGKHNAVNMMSAVLAAMAVGVTEEQIQATISSFKNVPHRLEDTGMINSVRFINDSKATNVDASKYALDSFDKPLIWIAGGVDKGNDYSEIEEIAYEKVKAMVCLGKDNTKLRKSFEGKVNTIIETDNISEAVTLANELAEKGDIVLLSPACASFDLFENYEDRGNQFKKAVSALERKQRRFNLYSFL
ncbi:MAG: UDP-N-acetylmuramoyl-L-alanine--D-glutamate ligase [Cyclobacteriaceae bacterium]